MDHADSERSTATTTTTSVPTAPLTGPPTSRQPHPVLSAAEVREAVNADAEADRAVVVRVRDSASSDIVDPNDIELPKPMSEGRPSAEAAEKALVRKPRIGDTMPMPTTPPPGPQTAKHVDR